MAEVTKCWTKQQIVEEPEELLVYLWETSRALTLTIMIYVILRTIYKRLIKKQEIVRQEEWASFPLARL